MNIFFGMAELKKLSSHALFLHKLTKSTPYKNMQERSYMESQKQGS